MAHATGIGVEIGEDQIRVIKLRRTARGILLQGVGSAPTPAGAISGGPVLDPRLLADGIRKALGKGNIRGVCAVVGLPGRAATSRVIEVPTMSEEELKSVVAGEMEHHRMLPMDQGTFDYVPLGEPDDTSRRTRLLVIGATKKMADSYRESLRLAGLRLSALEPASLAAARAASPALQTGGVALITVGACSSDFAVFASGSLRYSRGIDIGALDLSEDKTSGETGTLSGSVRPALLSVADDESGNGDLQALLHEIQRSLDFYHREAPVSARVERLVVVVDTQRVKDLAQFLRDHLDLPVAICDPLSELASDTDPSYEPPGPAYAPALGLALRMIQETSTTPCVDLSLTGRESQLARSAPRWLLYAIGFSLFLATGVLIAVLQINRSLCQHEVQLGEARVELARVSEKEQARTAAAQRVQEAQRIVQVRGLPWSDILFQVSSFMPQGVWLGDLEVESGNVLALQGSALSATSVATLMDSLTRSPLFQGPQMSSLEEQTLGGQPLVKYQVKVLLTLPVQQQAATAASLAPASGGAR